MQIRHSVCPFCGVGCQLTFKIRDDKILYADGRDGPANEERLCIKGRFGFDYIHNPERLTKPLVRKEGIAKHDVATLDPANPLTHFREASWEEALEIAANGLKKVFVQQQPSNKTTSLNSRKLSYTKPLNRKAQLQAKK